MEKVVARGKDYRAPILAQKVLALSSTSGRPQFTISLLEVKGQNAVDGE